MALERLNAAMKSEVDGALICAMFHYRATYLGRTNDFEVCLLPHEVPASPTEQQLRDAADAKATTAHTHWCAAVDLEEAAATPSETTLPPQGGTVL